MAEPLVFPHWHKPDANVGPVLVHSQAELDAYLEADWPNGSPGEDAPVVVDMTKAQLIEALEAKGATVDKSLKKADLAAQLAAL